MNWFRLAGGKVEVHKQSERQTMDSEARRQQELDADPSRTRSTLLSTPPSASWHTELARLTEDTATTSPPNTSGTQEKPNCATAGLLFEK